MYVYMYVCMYSNRHSRASISMDTVSSTTSHSKMDAEVRFLSSTMHIYIYIVDVCMYADGRLAKVYARTDFQGEEGSEEDAARAQHAGKKELG